MSMKVSIWGTDGRITADRQEVQIYYRGDDAEKLGLHEFWNVRYTTELTEGVWFYLRGEEYSAQMDHFFKLITSQANDEISSFTTALQADRVIDLIQRDAAGDVEPRVARPKPTKETFLTRLIGRS